MDGKALSILVLEIFLLLFVSIDVSYGQTCSEENCKLPRCYCAGRRGPLHLQTQDIPQMVVFTFDDALNGENFPFYKRLFRRGRNNPNGCPIAATFFVSHEWTNYKNVQELYLDGHEIGSHSITHQMPQSWWSEASYDELKKELEGQRKNIVQQANIPKTEIRGLRVPFLSTAGDTQFLMMKNEGFEYDSSFIAGPYFEGDWRLPIWPYTLDYAPGLEFCDNTNCPKSNFSGIWEFPLNRWIGLDGKTCPMVDACTTHNIDTKQKTIDYLMKNFKRSYDESRAPFGVNMHAKWFNDEHKLDAMDEFISQLLEIDNVYIITLHQVIEWMQNPVSQDEVREFSPWQSTCGKRRKLVATRTQPKPRLKVVHEKDDTIESDDIQADKNLRFNDKSTNEVNHRAVDTGGERNVLKSGNVLKKQRDKQSMNSRKAVSAAVTFSPYMSLVLVLFQISYIFH